MSGIERVAMMKNSALQLKLALAMRNSQSEWISDYCVNFRSAPTAPEEPIHHQTEKLGSCCDRNLLLALVCSLAAFAAIARERFRAEEVSNEVWDRGHWRFAFRVSLRARSCDLGRRNVQR